MTFKTIQFKDWFTIDIPENWECVEEEDLLTFYDTIDPKGALQISCFHIDDAGTDGEIVRIQLNKFMKQFEMKTGKDTIKIAENPHSTLAYTTGTIADDDFWKVWFAVISNRKLLLCTYNSDNKNNEVSIAESIVNSISPAISK